MGVHGHDWSDVEGAARELAGNWQRFESFGWHRRYELHDAPDWAIVYTRNRDSGILDCSNEEAIAKELEPFLEADDPDILAEHHGHWAVGWVDGYAIRVYRGGAVTGAFRKWCELMGRLADYPVLDEEDHSRREYEATLENIKDAGRRWLADDAPDDWVSRCWDWFWNNDDSAIECRDDQGGYPSGEEMRACLLALGFLDEWHMDEDELAEARLRKEKADAPGQSLLPFSPQED